jgi:hypothetical protein
LLDTTLESDDALEGRILWLPKKDEINEDLLVNVGIEDGCFHHPVMVLSVDQVERKATILIVSFLSEDFKSQLTFRSSLHSTDKILEKSTQTTSMSAAATSQSFPALLTLIIIFNYSSTATISSARSLTLRQGLNIVSIWRY